MKGIVWGSTIENAKKQLGYIEDRYFGIKVVRQYENEHTRQIVFDNGDMWVAQTANRWNTHGQRCNISYIDLDIDVDDFHKWILPCMTATPYTAFQFYSSHGIDGTEPKNNIVDFFR